VLLPPRLFLLLLATLFLLLAPRAAAQAPDTDAAAWEHLRLLDPPAGIRAYGTLIQDRARALAAETDPARAQALADAIELAAVHLLGAAEVIGNSALAREALAGAPVPERFGMAWARVHSADADLVAPLGLLVRWEFVGPFDNERGAAMTAPLPPEAEPDAARVWPGKVRDVAWRATPPGAHPQGIVRFSHLVRPWEQSAVLARTWVRADADLDALLLLGAGEEARVWINGEPILDASEAHERRLDALAAPCRLRVGWNEIAVKLGARDDELALQARLVRAADGAPLRLAHGLPPERPAPCPLSAAPAPPADPAARPGAFARVAANPTPHGLADLGTLQAFHHSGPRHTYPGRAALDAAAAAAPDDLRIALAHLGAHAPADFERSEELDINPWLQAIREVQRLSPEEPGALIDEFRLALLHQSSVSRAAALLARLRAALPGAVASEFSALQLAEKETLEPLASAIRRALLANPATALLPDVLHFAAAETHPPGSSARHAAFAAVFTSSGDPADLEFLLEEEARARPGFDLGAERAALARHLALDPWFLRPRFEFAELMLAAGHLADARAALHDALAICPEHPRAHALLARVHLAAGAPEAAIAALERELEYDFSADDERRLLEHLLAASRGASFDAAYAEPLAAILARRDAAALAAPAGSGSEILLWRTVVRVHPDGTAQHYYRKVARVLDARGAREYDVVRFPYASGDQELRVLAADVLKADGSLDRARTGRGGRSGGMDLPALAPGDVVDLAWRVDDLRPTFFGRYFGIDHALTPDPSVPVAESEIVLLVPPELPLRLHARNWPASAPGPAERPLADGGRELRWRLTDLAPARLESLMPHGEEIVPAVQASSYASWEEFGAWWWNLIAPGITSSPEMREKIAELVAGRVEPLERVRAIYEFVANDVRYNAWEFGVHGYQPYSAPVIFSRKFGDCKDKAILLRAMLAEIGVEAFPVLIKRAGTAEWQGRRPAEDHSLAMVSHFNHCIAYVPAQPGVPEMWLDGTARLHTLETLPYDDRGAAVLVVRPDGAARARIPESDAAADRDTRRFTVELRADGGARIGVELAPRGRFDAEFRSLFSGGREEVRERAEQLLTGLAGPFAGAADLDFPEVEDLAAPRSYRLGADFGSFARAAEGALELPAAIGPLELLRGPGLEPVRGTDLLLDGAQTREQEIEVRLPDGWVLAAPPAPISADCGDAAYSWSLAAEPGLLRIRERFELRAARIPASRYAAFRELCRIVDQTQKQDLRLEAAHP
jgi:hypothetical protein